MCVRAHSTVALIAQLPSSPTTGTCKHGTACRFAHDRSQVSVCRLFLAGQCHNEACTLSHSVDQDKLPACSFFQRGACKREACPYRHVRVAANAEVCTDFQQVMYQWKGCAIAREEGVPTRGHVAQGHCPRGSDCKLLHTHRRRRKAAEAGGGSGGGSGGSSGGGSGDQKQHKRQRITKKGAGEVGGAVPRSVSTGTSASSASSSSSTTGTGVVEHEEEQVSIRPAFTQASVPATSPIL